LQSSCITINSQTIHEKWLDGCEYCKLGDFRNCASEERESYSKLLFSCGKLRHNAFRMELNYL
jgi:hypothetical protein